ncbi:ABC transporter ATP-binding protein [Enterococcus sp. BWM-S5]|uniref:ABC transporter ATP-binding protein n=1 Tax=Enterococcus larvae TaxID=2794352 RepID=A0ABS4CLC2_9ENTE|nr:ABC transporter ATP-binding protein [Enterococcus larvae]MBP1047402.1 ABC transporter ATP-binding protein [Enterococcus larvae]
MTLLDVKNITKEYPSFAIRDISFIIPKGKIIGLIGKNGAGKSTTLKSILNLIPIDHGEIEMFGKDFFTEEIYCKQNLGVVLGGVDFYKEKKIKDITKVTKRFYTNWDDAAYQNYLSEFSLDPEKKIKELSAGMQVKYSIALALSHHAKLLIFDEPTSGLDPVSRDDLITIFLQIVKSGERSILFSTHITSDLEKCADGIIYIKDGALIKSAEKIAFIDSFQYLKTPEDIQDLSLEEIMIRMEGKHYDF